MSETQPGREAGRSGNETSRRRHAVAQSLAIGPMFSTALLLGLISNPVTGAVELRPRGPAGGPRCAQVIGYVVALYARRFAGAGAVYEYLTHGAHLWIGVLTAGIFFIGTLFLGAAGFTSASATSPRLLEHPHLRQRPGVVGLGLIALAIVLALNYIGVRIAVGAMPTFAAVSFVPMLILAIVIVAKGGADGISLERLRPR